MLFRSFELAEHRQGRLLRRALLVLAISVIFLSLSLHNIPLARADSKPLHLSIYFIGVMLCWMEMQLAFAVYYAKLYFHNNPLSSRALPCGQPDGNPAAAAPDLLQAIPGSRDPVDSQEPQEPQELIFPGRDVPGFTDFVYVAVTVALTFAVSDVDIESSRMRRLVLLQALLSFFFYTMIFSVVANLLINNA